MTILLRVRNIRANILWDPIGKFGIRSNTATFQKRGKGMRKQNILRILTVIALCFAGGARADSHCSTDVPVDVCKIETMIYMQTNFKNTTEVRRDLLGLKDLLVKYSSGPVHIKEH